MKMDRHKKRPTMKLQMLTRINDFVRELSIHDVVRLSRLSRGYNTLFSQGSMNNDVITSRLYWRDKRLILTSYPSSISGNIDPFSSSDMITLNRDDTSRDRYFSLQVNDTETRRLIVYTTGVDRVYLTKINKNKYNGIVYNFTGGSRIIDVVRYNGEVVFIERRDGRVKLYNRYGSATILNIEDTDDSMLTDGMKYALRLLKLIQ